MLDTQLIEREFGYLGDHAYLDASVVGIPPERVKTACRTFMDDYVAAFYWDFEPERQQAKENFARLIHASPQEITFEKNVTEGNSILAMGYTALKPGTNVIVADSDFPNTLYPWINAHKQRGFELKVYKTRRGQIPARDIITMMDDNTRVVAMSAVQSGWGYFADLKAIGAECRKRGIVFAVDGVQAVGRMSVDVQECCIDYMTCGGFKALMGTFGSSFLYCSSRIVRDILPLVAGYQSAKDHVLAPGVTTDFSEIHFHDDARRLEAGSRNNYGINAMSKGVELILELGMPAIEKHILSLEELLRSRLEALPLDVITPAEPARMSGMVVLLFPEELTERAREIMKKHKVHVSIRKGYIRITIALFNTRQHIETLCRALSELCGHIPAGQQEER